MGEKTKAQLKKELEVTRREERWAHDQLRECQTKNSILSQDAEKSRRGWTIHIHEQVHRGEFSSERQIAKNLLDNGIWFFELKKD